MRELLLRDLERRIRLQRRQLVDDKQRIERALADIPAQALRAVGSANGLATSFALGAAASAVAQPAGQNLLWDILVRVAIAELPDIGDLMRDLGGAAGDAGA
jgi:hypothetical protein